MTDQLASSAIPAKSEKTLPELSHMAVQFAGLCEALDPIYEQASAGHMLSGNVVADRAMNAMPPLIDTLIRDAWALADAIAKLADRAEVKA